MTGAEKSPLQPSIVIVAPEGRIGSWFKPREADVGKGPLAVSARNIRERNVHAVGSQVEVDGCDSLHERVIQSVVPVLVSEHEARPMRASVWRLARHCPLGALPPAKEPPGCGDRVRPSIAVLFEAHPKRTVFHDPKVAVDDVTTLATVGGCRRLPFDPQEVVVRSQYRRVAPIPAGRGGKDSLSRRCRPTTPRVRPVFIRFAGRPCHTTVVGPSVMGRIGSTTLIGPAGQVSGGVNHVLAVGTVVVCGAEARQETGPRIVERSRHVLVPGSVEIRRESRVSLRSADCIVRDGERIVEGAAGKGLRRSVGVDFERGEARRAIQAVEIDSKLGRLR